MNKKEFSAKINWDEYGIGHVKAHVPIFEKELEFELFSDHAKKPDISTKMFATVEDVLNLPDGALEKIKDLLWEEAQFSFTVADYGCIPQEGETVKNAHFREFGLHTKQDTFEKSYIKAVQIQYESDVLDARYAELKVESATDNLISIIVKNGTIIDFDDDGAYLGAFEKNNQYAHTQRKKVLNGSI